MILFSTLILTIPSRTEKFKRLYTRLQQQVPPGTQVEILSLFDNKLRSIGVKRDNLLQLAQGKYLTYIDDDDDVELDYIPEVINAINKGNNCDVICYKESASINGGNRFIVDYSLKYENEDARQIENTWIDIKRKPFHKCVWRTDLARTEHFQNSSYGEDWDWAKRLCAKAKTEYKIDKIIYTYDYSEKTSEAPGPKNEKQNTIN